MIIYFNSNLKPQKRYGMRILLKCCNFKGTAIYWMLGSFKRVINHAIIIFENGCSAFVALMFFLKVDNGPQCFSQHVWVTELLYPIASKSKSIKFISNNKEVLVLVIKREISKLYTDIKLQYDFTHRANSPFVIFASSVHTLHVILNGNILQSFEIGRVWWQRGGMDSITCSILKTQGSFKVWFWI